MLRKSRFIISVTLEEWETSADEVLDGERQMLFDVQQHYPK